MGSVKVTSRGDWKKTTDFLRKMARGDMFDHLSDIGRMGVDALSRATPVRTGYTASSWDYEVVHENGSWAIIWSNHHVEDGVNIAVILQYGHATGTGGYVPGIDYINPAMDPVYTKAIEDFWKVVKNG